MSWSNESKLVFVVVLCAAIIACGVMIRDNYSPQRGMTGFAVDGSPTAANQPPQWISNTAKFTAVQDAPLVLALNELFSDPEGQQMTYIATQAENMAVDLQDDRLTITPEQGFAGERVVTIMASDGENVTTQRIKVEVSLTGAANETVQPAVTEPVLNETVPSEPVPAFQTSELPNFTTFAAPSIVQVIVNTTNPATNDTGQNVTMYAINATDTDNDPVQNITDWKLNNKSIAPVYWPFETNTSSTSAGAIRGYSLDGFNATLNTAPGTPTWISSGRLGGAYSFDGNDYLTSAASMDIGTNYSLEFWFNPASSTNWQVLVGNDMFGANYYGTLYYMPSNSPAQLWYYQGGSNYATATNIPPSGWQYIALTYNGTNTKIYVNGTLNVVGNAHTERFNNQIRLGMNIVLWGSEQYYFGSMDEVRVYNRTLTAEQVAANYRKGFENKTTDTIVPQETSTGEVWGACATPNDAGSDGSTVCGDNVTIKDEEPVINRTNLTGCPATINTSAILANNVSSSGTCITFGADNIELDCLGYNISYGSGGGNAVNGILANSRRNITVRNCNIIGTKATGAWDTGINFTYVNDSSVINNNITTNGSQFGNGINFVIDSNRNTIANNTILTFGANGYGIYLLYNSSGNNITGNIIRTNGSDSYAVNMINRITDTIIGSNNITTVGSAIVTATYSSRNNISDNNITSIYISSTRYGISITNSENNTIKNNIVLAQDSSINLAYTSGNIIAGNLLTMNTTFFTPYVTYWASTNNTLFSNNTVATISDGCGLMRMNGVNNNNIVSSNTFLSNNVTSYSNNGGIVIDGGLNNTFAYNQITGYFGGVGIGFTITSNTNYTNISNNNISILGGSSHIGIKIGSQSSTQSSDSQIIENNQITLNATSSQGILITWVSTNNTFRNNKITTTGANSYGVYIGTSNSSFFNSTTINSSRGWIILFANTMNNFTNTTFMTPSGAISILPLMQLNGTRDIDNSKLNITNRRAFLNSSNLTFFNTTGIIALNNVSFINPAPTVDWADTGAYVACPASVCTALSYSGNTSTFNVTHFTGFGTFDAGNNITGCPVTINQSTTLTQNLESNESCIDINNNNLVLDCNGYNITFNRKGGADFGINATNFTNLTIRNCIIIEANITGGSTGIYLLDVSNSTIEYNNVTVNGSSGSISNGIQMSSSVYGLFLSDNNTIANNTVRVSDLSGSFGILLNYFNSNHRITGNRIDVVNGTPMNILWYAKNLLIAGNQIRLAAGGASVGIGLQNTNNSLFENNTVEFGSPSAGYRGITISDNCNYNIVSANNFSSTMGKTGPSAIIIQANNNYAINNIINISGQDCEGITVSFKNNTITGNKITVNGNITAKGIYISGTNHTIAYNNISGTGPDTGVIAIATYGIYSFGASYTNITQNNITVNGTSSYGIYVRSTNHNNTVKQNIIIASGSSNNNYGIYLNVSAETNFTGNIIITNGTANNHGILLDSAFGNSQSNRFDFNNISTSGAQSFGIVIIQTNSTLFNNTLLNNTVEWINSSANTLNNFTNTIFAMPNGSINIQAITQLNGSAEITKAKLNITNNSAFLNSTNLTFLNTTGIITLYGITAANPEPQVDWSDSGAYVNCPAGVCTELGFAGNTYVFNVSHFTGFSTYDAGSLTNITTCPFPITGNAVLGNNISSNGSCLAVNGNDLTLDCMGYSISYGADNGSNEHGIDVGNSHNVTIRNCTIRGLSSLGNFSDAINFSSVINSTIISSSITANGSNFTYGVHLLSSANNTIVSNAIRSIGQYSDSYGVFLESGSSGAVIANNTILANTSGFGDHSRGIYASQSSLLAILSNNITSDVYNITSNAIFLSISTGTNITGNTITAVGNISNNGINLYLFVNATISRNNIRTAVRDAAGAGIYVLASSTALIEYNNISSQNYRNSGWGILLEGANSIIDHNNITTNGSINGQSRYNRGIYAIGGSNHTITNNFINAYGYDSTTGVYVSAMDNSRFENNTVYEPCGWWQVCAGMYFDAFADNNTILGNTVYTDAGGASYALFMQESSNNTLRNNTFTTNTPIGVYLYNGSADNTIDNNSISTGNNAAGDYGGNSVLISTALGGNKVINNRIRMENAPSTAAVYLTTYAHDSVIANNTITMPNLGSTDTTTGIYLYTNCLNNFVDNNTIVFLVSGNSNKGVYVRTNSDNNIITNNKINLTGGNNQYCILVDSSVNTSIRNNTLYSSASGGFAQGIVVQNAAQQVSAYNNTINTSGYAYNYGIYANLGHNSTFIDNKIFTQGSDSYGIIVENSQNDTFANNLINTSGDGMIVLGTQYLHFLTHSFTNTNLVNGSPIYYYGGAGSSPACPNNQVIDAPTWAQIDFMGCTNVTLKNYRTLESMVLVNATNMTIAGSSITNTRYGLRLYLNTTNTIVENNTINATNTTYLTQYGVWIYQAQNNTVRYNNISQRTIHVGESGQADITAYISDSSSDNNLTDNQIFSDCKYGVVVSSADNLVARNNITATEYYGFCTGIVAASTDNTFANNTINMGSHFDRDVGASISSSRSIFANNTIYAPATGISLSYATNNTIDSNNVFAQSVQGIYCEYSSLNRFTNNIVNLTSLNTNTRGLRFTNSQNNTFANNTLLSLGSGSSHYGIYIDNSRNNTIENNTIRTNGTSNNVGIYLQAYNYDHTFANNIIIANGTSTDNHGIQIGYSENNTFRNNTVWANGSGTSHAVYLQYLPDSNTFTDNRLSAGTGSACIYVSQVSNISFNNTVLAALSPSTYWFYGAAGTITNASNTTFSSSSGSIGIIPLIELNATNITQQAINVTFNKAFLNTTNLSFFNTSAVIMLGGLAYSNAVPTVDFDDSGVYVVCPGSVCTVIGYSGGTLAFSTTHFTSYSSQEAPISNVSNLTLTKTDYPDPVTASTNLTYKINVSVRGNGTAFNVTVNDTYPLQAIYLTSSPSPVSGTNNTWILGNLSQGTNISINITLLVLNITDGAVINNTANASFQNESGTLLQLQVTENTTVSNPPVFNQSSVIVVKTGSPNPVNASANLTYQINITSAGNGTAFNVTVNDTYPSQVIYLASQPTPLAGTNNTWILGNLTPGTSILINATVLVMNVSNGTVINNTVNATFQNETSGLLSSVDTESTTVLNAPLLNLTNMSITKTDSPDPVNASSNLTYQVNISTTGNGTAYSVNVLETYPNEVIYLSAQPSPTTGNNTWALGNFTAGTNLSINITVLVRNITNGSVINNIAEVVYNSGGNYIITAFQTRNATSSTTVLNPRLVNSTIINSSITNCTIINSTVINSNKSDCTIINSVIIDSNNTNTTIINSNETNSTDINSTVDHSIIIDTTKINAIINNSNITNSTINWTIVINSTINSTNLTNCSVINSTLNGINNQSCTYLNFNPNLNPPIPPGPGPQPGGGGGGGGGGGVRRNQTTAQPPAIKCTESWICDDWSACFGNRQVRECSEVNACGTRNYVPATERQCVKAPETVPAPEVIPPLTEEISAIKAPETVSAEKKPLLEIPAVTAMCPVAPIVLDSALILFVLFILAYFLLMLRKKSKGSHLFLDVPAVIILLLLAFNYATCAEFLLLQYIIYAVLVIFSLILHLIPARQEERISETPGTEEFYKHLEEIDRKLASIEGAKPRSSVKQIRKTPEEERIERELDRIAREKVSVKIKKAEPLPAVKAPVARAPEQRKVLPAGKAEPKVAQVKSNKFYSRLDDIDRKLAKEEKAKPRAVKAAHIAKPAEDKRIEQEFNRLAHVKIAVPKQGLFSRLFKPKPVVAKPEPVKPAVEQKPAVARQIIVKPAPVRQAPQPKPVVVKPAPVKPVVIVPVKQKPSKDRQQFYGKMNQLDAELAKVEHRLKTKRGKSK